MSERVTQSRTHSLQAFWSAGQRREDSGDIEFYYRRISAVKQWKPLRNSQSKKLNFFNVPRVFPALPCRPKTLKTLGTRLRVTLLDCPKIRQEVWTFINATQKFNYNVTKNDQKGMTHGEEIPGKIQHKDYFCC